MSKHNESVFLYLCTIIYENNTSKSSPKALRALIASYNDSGSAFCSSCTLLQI